MHEELFPKQALQRGYYPWLAGHPTKAGAPPKGTPAKSKDAAAKRGAESMSFASKR